jgi:hypothetical protein
MNHAVSVSNKKQVRNFSRQMNMANGSYEVTTDLFPREALQVYSAYNLGQEVSSKDQDTYFSAHRGGSQGDYRQGMEAKMANVVDCLRHFPNSKRALMTVPNTSFPSHTSDDDAKCLREIHFYLDDDNDDKDSTSSISSGNTRKKKTLQLNATVWMRAQAAEIFPKNIHFIGSLMDRVASQLQQLENSDANTGTGTVTTTIVVGELFYLATTLVSVREN